MTRGVRLLAFVGVLALGFVATIFLVGGQVGSCLGPLGVTEVQCIRASGVAPTVGMALPIILGLVAVAAFALFPVPHHRARAGIVSGVAGAIVGAIAYVVLHPSSMTGATSTGEVITVPLPIDAPALVSVALVGAAGAALLAGHLRRGLASRSA